MKRIGRAVFLGLASGCVVGACTKPAAPQPQFDRTPILFVHGSGLSSASWRELQRELIARGYPENYLLALDMHPRDGGNEIAAQAHIAPAVDELLERAERAARSAGFEPPRRVDIVAHSMGAFSSRWYLTQIDATKSRVWIGIAGANFGTDALCGGKGAGDRQMCPAFAPAGASLVQNALNGTREVPLDPTPFGIGPDAANYVRAQSDAQRCIAYYTLRIEPDEWIEPANSAVVAGAGGLHVEADDLPAIETTAGNFLFTEPTIHDDLPKHPRAIEFVTRVLAAADAQLAAKCEAARQPADEE